MLQKAFEVQGKKKKLVNWRQRNTNCVLIFFFVCGIRVLPVDCKLVGGIILRREEKKRRKENNKERMPMKKRKKKCDCLSGEMVWEIKNAHIQPLRFRELFLFSPIEQFEASRKKNNKTSKHMSLTFSNASVVTGARRWVSVFVCVSSSPPGCSALPTRMYGFVISPSVCVCQFASL